MNKKLETFLAWAVAALIAGAGVAAIYARWNVLRETVPGMGGLDESIPDAVIDAYHDGWTYGLTPGELAAFVAVSVGVSDSDLPDSAVEAAKANRASMVKRIAATVVLAATVAKAQEVLESDANAYVWRATLDDRTRPEHAAADGQTQPKGQPFVVGGELLRYPGDTDASPANFMNCRCYLEPTNG